MRLSRPRFSLRTLMVAILVIGLSCGVVVRLAAWERSESKLAALLSEQYLVTYATLREAEADARLFVKNLPGKDARGMSWVGFGSSLHLNRRWENHPKFSYRFQDEPELSAIHLGLVGRHGGGRLKPILIEDHGAISTPRRSTG